MKAAMDLTEMMTSRIDQILDKVGPGMKVLLMDQDTTTSVSLSCPQSKIMKKEVFLFEHLHSRVPSKNSLSYLKCVVLLRPTMENLSLLKREIASPRYGSYHVFFTNKIRRSDLKTLAESDANEVVSMLMEVPSDFYVLESHLFTTNMPRPVKNLRWNKSTGALQRCVDSLRSFLLALKSPGATIAYMKDSPLAEELAQQVVDGSTHEGSSDTTLVILDRRIDPVTPLLNQWTYQAMINELIGTANNTVDLTGREDVPDDVKKMILSAEYDEFYKLNMYSNFGEIGQTIQTLVQNYQDKVKSHKKVDSIGDIKDFVSSYPEFKKMSGTVSKHLALVGELSKEIKANSLLEISECEQTLACGLEKDNSVQELQRILSLPNIRTKDALRLVSLFTLRYSREVERHLDMLCRSVKGIPKKEVYDVIQMTSKYGRIKSSLLFDKQSNPFTANFFKGLKGTENVYTQHQPLITKEMLPDIIRGRPRNDLNYLSQPEAASKTVIFVIGGVTYEESRAVHLFNKEQRANVVLGGTSLLNFDEFLSSMREACESNENC